MSIQVRCPSCHEKYNLPDALNGRRVRCKQCAKAFTADPGRGAEVLDAEEAFPAGDRELASGLQPASRRLRVPPRDHAGVRDERTPPARRRFSREDERGEPQSREGVSIGLIIGGLLAAFVFLAALGGGALWLVLRASTQSRAAAEEAAAQAEHAREAAQRQEENRQAPEAARRQADNRRPFEPIEARPAPPAPPVLAPRENRPPPEPIAWNVKPDPPPAVINMTVAGKKTLPLKPLQGRPGKTVVVYPTRSSPFVAVGDTFFPQEEREIWDLRTMQKIGTLQGTGMLNHPTLSPDGAYVAGFVQVFSLSVYSVKDGKQILHVPSDAQQNGFEDYVEFAGPQRVLVGSNQTFTRNYRTFDLTAGKLLKQFKHEPQPVSAQAVSPGGRYLAVASGHRITIYDLDSGTAAGEVPIPKRPEFDLVSYSLLAFSPDGKELAYVSNWVGHQKYRTFCWDLTNNKLAVEHILQPELPTKLPANQATGPRFEWLDDKSGWLLDASLFDYESGGLAWRVPHQAVDQIAANRHMIGTGHIAVLTGEPDNRILELIALPKDEIAAAIKAARAGGKKD